MMWTARDESVHCDLDGQRNASPDCTGSGLQLGESAPGLCSAAQVPIPAFEAIPNAALRNWTFLRKKAFEQLSKTCQERPPSPRFERYLKGIEAVVEGHSTGLHTLGMQLLILLPRPGW